MKNEVCPQDINLSEKTIFKFTENTDFDAEKALQPGTREHQALLSDLDVMAGILRPFCDQEVPILWRPFHEGDGTWFW